LFGLRPEDRVLQFASLNFDASVAETATALAVGASLHLASPERLLPGSPLVETLRRQEITCVTLPPSALAVLEGEDLPALATLITAGEACSPELARRWSAGRRFINAYGPTEATVCATGGRYLGGTRLPIGTPIANTRVYLVDRRGRMVGTGTVGELCIAGAGVARGYLERPALTAERFVPDPLSGDPTAGTGGERLYRTGDLARYLPDGAIEFLGRIDHQVKLRGFRVELGEIEAVLSRHPAVRENAVLVREETRGDRRPLPARPLPARPLPARLVAYLVVAVEMAPPAWVLREFLQATLPDYMVPSAFVMLETLPLTPAGKVDRAALERRPLAAAERARGPVQEGLVAPGDPTEELLAGIWATVLGVERVGSWENFFELGGHSLLATQAVSRIREVFGVELPLLRFFEAPTVAEMVEVIRSLQREQQGVSIPPLLPVARDRELPLSFAQQRLWFLDQLDPGSAAYSIPLAVHLGDAVETELLERIFNEMARRHEALRTTFAVVAGEPHQVIAEEFEVRLPVVELERLAAEDRRIEAERLAAAEARRPFDLTRGPIVRFTLVCLTGGEQVVMATMHHIVSDGWSMGIFLRELAALSDAFSRGEPSPLAELPVQYADFAHWQRQWLAGELLEIQLSYWRKQLAGAPPRLDLATDRPRPAVQTFRGRNLGMALSEPLSGALATLAREQGVTLFMTLVAVFKILLSRFAGQDDVVVGTPIAGRNHKEIEGLIGFFVNTLVLRTDLAGGTADRDPPYRELLARVREMALGAYAHQDLPFEHLVEVLQPQRDLSSTPLFQVMFILQNVPREDGEMGGLAMSPLETGGATAKFDLTLSFEESTRGVSGALGYNTDLFDRTTIERLRAHFELLLAAVVDAPDERAGELPWFAAAERHQLLVEWNDTASADPPAGSIHELFERQVKRTPEAVALVFH
ncbi:MAG: AMP-binding protein, partial [bacterium]|nr:AMP-binding protein [bacterium]